jgi:hypothetical protein
VITPSNPTVIRSVRKALSITLTRTITTGQSQRKRQKRAVGTPLISFGPLQCKFFVLGAVSALVPIRMEFGSGTPQ